MIALAPVLASVLPEGLQFLKPGWWLLHVLAFALVFVYGYRKGRLDERRDGRAKGDGKTKERVTP